MWTTQLISGRQADVYIPSSGSTEKACIYLHGYSGETLTMNETFTEQFERHQLAVVAPHGGPCWWLDKISPAFDQEQAPATYVTTDLVNWISEQWNVSLPGIGLLGVSMGGQGVLNIAYRNALRFPVVAAISPAIDFDSIYGAGFGIEEIFENAEAARQETAVLHLHPLNWPKHQLFVSDPLDACWHHGSERLASKLSSSGIRFESDLTTSQGGHGWPYFNLMAERVIAFISTHLSK
ncbi:alpha/beta hydrolase-fold protein [Planctomicrobium sp. SH668]|uniref:alpha/beta hydrolase-fold protein n=1 Tax=Planctomicrobium sp. SH668 TaxID=3448126 RepID=UPI003F5B8877